LLILIFESRIMLNSSLKLFFISLKLHLENQNDQELALSPITKKLRLPMMTSIGSKHKITLGSP